MMNNKILYVYVPFLILAFCVSVVAGYTIDRNAKPENAADLEKARNYIRHEIMCKVDELGTPELLESEPEKVTFTYYDVPLDYNIQAHLVKRCRENNIDPKLMLAVIKHESDFKPNVVSATNDYGLCQINECHMEKFRGWYGDDILEPYSNINYGVDLLGYYLVKAQGNEKKALLMYQYGESGAKGKTSSLAVEDMLKIRNTIKELRD